MSRLKRIISFLLGCFMLISSCPLQVFAYENELPIGNYDLDNTLYGADDDISSEYFEEESDALQELENWSTDVSYRQDTDDLCLTMDPEDGEGPEDAVDLSDANDMQDNLDSTERGQEPVPLNSIKGNNSRKNDQYEEVARISMVPFSIRYSDTAPLAYSESSDDAAEYVDFLTGGINHKAVNKKADDGELIGDVNTDGQVTDLDLIILSRSLAGWEGYKNRIFSEDAADVDREGSVSAADRLILARFLAGIPEYETYFWDYEVEKYRTRITSLNQDGFGTVTLAWADAGDDVSYNLYEKKRDGSITLLTTTGDLKAEVSVVGDGVYSYAVSVTYLSDSGVYKEGELSEFQSIDVHIIWVSGISIRNIEQTSANRVWIEWTGVYPIDTYSVYLVSDGSYFEVAKDITGCSCSVTVSSPGKYEFAVRGAFIDTYGTMWQTRYSGGRSVTVVDGVFFAPPAPELIFAEGEEFSKKETDIPSFKIKDFSLLWTDCPGAESYGISLERKNGTEGTGSFEPVLLATLSREKDILSAEVSSPAEDIGAPYCYVSGDTVGGTSFILTQNLFDGVEQKTVYKVSLWSNGEKRGESANYYFALEPFSETILINEKSAIQWDRTNSQAGSRVFTVSSDLPWTAESSAEWITLTPDSSRIEVTISAHYFNRDYRTGNVTVSNGRTSASITIHQGPAETRNHPEMRYRGELLSTDLNNPTSITAGGFEVEIDRKYAKYALIKVWEYLGNGRFGSSYTWKTISGSAYTFPYEWGSKVFESGKTFKIELSGHYSSNLNVINANEQGDDTLKQVYYITMTEEGRYLDIEGRANLSILMEEKSGVVVHASNICTVECEPQVSWLKYEIDDYEDGQQYISLTAEPNNSAERRTAVIAVYCGTLRGEIIVTQKTSSESGPHFLVPEAMSEDENNPTVFSTPTLYVNVIGKLTLEAKTTSGYSSKLYSNVSGDVVLKGLKSGTIYRITLIKNLVTKYYYFKLSKSTSYTLDISYAEETRYTDELDKTIASIGSTFDLLLKSTYRWTAESDVPWLKLSKTSGAKGTGVKVSVTAEANTTGEDRSGLVSFMINSSVHAICRVYQNGSDDLILFCKGHRLDADHGLQHLSGAGEDLYIDLYGSEYNEAHCSSTVDWIVPEDNITVGYGCSVEISPNNTGSVRNGKLVFTCGTVSVSVPIIQEPLVGIPKIISPVLSTDEKNPTLLTYSRDGLVLKWNHAEYAAQYSLRIEYKDDAGWHSMRFAQTDTGSGTQVFTVPAECFNLDFDGEYTLLIKSLDPYGNEGKSMLYYYAVTPGSTVYISGSTKQVWDKVTDFATSSSYTIASSGNWTAASNVSWITLDRTSGASGDTLTVNVSQNGGQARTGVVSVTSAGATGTLTVSQCAVIPDEPALLTPELSDDSTAPTVYTDLTELTATWGAEPQAKYYRLKILVPVEGSFTLWETKYDSEKLAGTASSYRFNNLQLDPGQLYKLEFSRYRFTGSNTTSRNEKAYYFTILPDNPFVEAKTASLKLSGEWHGEYIQVKSSGTWTVVSEVPWIIVGVGQYYEFPDNEGFCNRYSGNSGEGFYLSVLDNDTGRKRTGIITVSTLGASETIQIEQEQQYTKPVILSPDLSSPGSSSEHAEVPFADIPLSWSAGSGNTGVYDVTLSEKRTDGSTYTQIWTKTGMTERSCTIPKSVLKEAKAYKLKLSTELINNGGTINRIYYFRTKAANELTVSADVNWEAVETGGYVTIQAFASGGVGGYFFTYELLLDGKTEAERRLEGVTEFAFLPQSSGAYTVRVSVLDASGAEAQYVSEYQLSGSNVLSLKTTVDYYRSEEIDSAYHILKYRIYSDDSWTVTECADWLKLSDMSGTGTMDVSVMAEQNDTIRRIGKIVFRNARTRAKAVLTITQNSDIQIALYDETALITEKAQNVYIQFASSAEWKASSDSSWAVLSAGRGEVGNGLVYVSVKENTGTDERVAVITLSAGGQSVAFSIRQVGMNAEGSIGLSRYTWQIESFESEILPLVISTAGSWSIVSKPEWIIATTDSGKGSASISLCALGNPDQGVRSGEVVFEGSGENRVLKVAQSGTDIAATVKEFEIGAEQTMTGIKVVFRVRTKLADKVQLIVDGSAYQEYNVYGDYVEFERAFTSDGLRRIRILPIRRGAKGIISEEHILKVTSKGPLAKPSIHPIESILLGEDRTVSWDPVPNAEQYTVYLSHGNDYRKLDEIAAPETSLMIPAELLSESGMYRIGVYATAIGYSQSGNNAEFEVIQPIADFSLDMQGLKQEYDTHVNIEFMVHNPSEFNVKIKVSCSTDSGEHYVWYLPEDSCINGSQGQVSFSPDYAGQYEVSLLGYTAKNMANPEKPWNNEVTDFRFSILPGAIVHNSLSVGNGGSSQNREKVTGLSLKTSKSVIKVEIYDNGNTMPIITLNATDNSVEIENNKRYYRYNQTIGLSEGFHDFKFVSIDHDGLTDERHFRFYAYSPSNQQALRYPASRSIYLYKYPVSDSEKSSGYDLSDNIVVNGTYGANYYYVSIGDKKGYVKKSDTVTDQIIEWDTYRFERIDWPNGRKAYVYDVFLTPKDYNIKLSWRLNKPLPEGYKYNVYLYKYAMTTENITSPYVYKKINSTPITGSSIYLNTAQLKTLYNIGAVVTEFYLKIDVIDRNGHVVLEGHTDEYTECMKATTDLETVKKCLKICTDVTVVYHDLLYKGNYSDENGINQGDGSGFRPNIWQYVYTVGVGNIQDIRFSPVTKAALIAEAVMKEISGNKEDCTEVLVEEIEKCLKVMEFGDELLKRTIGLVWDKKESFMKWDDWDVIREKCKAAGEDCGFQSLVGKSFENIQNGVEFGIMIYNIIRDLVWYWDVTRSDVQNIISDFRRSNDTTLHFAANYLEMMTRDKATLSLYLGLAYGGKVAKKKLAEIGYDFVNAIIPGYKAMTCGVSSVTDIVNAEKIFSAVYDLQAVMQSVETVRNEYLDYWDTFISNPSEYYKEFIRRRDLFLKLHRYELQSYQTVLKSISDSDANRFVMYIFEQFGVNFEKEISVDDMIYECGHKLFDQYWEAYYNGIIFPFVK